MNYDPRSMTRPQRIVLCGMAITGAVCGLVYLAPPASHSFYPRCPLHMLTGLQCPGCGATRALYEVLHGNLAAAWAYNQLFVAVLPFLVLFLVVQLVHVLRQGTWYVIP